MKLYNGHPVPAFAVNKITEINHSQ